MQVVDIPDYQTAMLPVLTSVRDGREYTRREIVKKVADFFGLTPEQRAELLPSGKTPVVRSRVGWALTYLKQAGLLESRKRGVYTITARGKEALDAGIPRVDVKYLEQYQEFLDFRNRTRESRRDRTDSVASRTSDPETPTESLESAYQQLRDEVESELLDLVAKATPEFFEHLVVELLVAMGYGGSRRDAGQAIGQSGDGGIDGIIKEDRLGLDVIYVQAKRWQATVGRPDIQKFAGALQGMRARKGVFLTTSGFSREAIEYAGSIDTKLVLIDGSRLSALMFDFNVGVNRTASYEIKEIDSDFFDEDQIGVA